MNYVHSFYHKTLNWSKMTFSYSCLFQRPFSVTIAITKTNAYFSRTIVTLRSRQCFCLSISMCVSATSYIVNHVILTAGDRILVYYLCILCGSGLANMPK